MSESDRALLYIVLALLAVWTIGSYLYGMPGFTVDLL